MTTAAQAMVVATARLRAAGVDDPARDARVLLAHAARVDATRITLIAPEDISDDIADRYEHLIALRAVRVPVSHLIGTRDFYGRKFSVSGDVLDPRPDTETLIETALAAPYSRILDLGTGSGCILVTLLAERPEATGLGVDLSDAACLQASANAVLNHVDARAQIIQSDWFSNVSGSFDLIASNPPYIAASEMPGLAPEVRDHEPHMALTDGGDGLGAYRILCALAPDYLTPEGRLMVEIGPTQGRAVAQLMQQGGLLDVAIIIPDIDGRDRVVMGRAEKS